MQKIAGALSGATVTRLRQSSNAGHKAAKTGRSRKHPESFQRGGRPGRNPSFPATDAKSAAVSLKQLDSTTTPVIYPIQQPKTKAQMAQHWFGKYCGFYSSIRLDGHPVDVFEVHDTGLVADGFNECAQTQIAGARTQFLHH
jgi:hypothetical protein